MKRFIQLLFCFIPLLNIGQIGVGTWQDHLPYGNCIDVCDGGDVIYCASPYSVFYYDIEDNSINRLSRVEGLAEAEISAINYDFESKSLLVGCVNGNIDFFVNENRVVNLGDLKNSSILADKSINSIYFKDGKAFLACGFGIVVVDIQKNEISETYIIGPNTSYVNVLDLVIIENQWWAATDQGVFVADVNNPFLVSFESWTKLDDLPNNEGTIKNIEVNDNRIYLFTMDPEDDEAEPQIYFRDRVPESSWIEWSDYRNTAYTDIYVDNDNIVVQDFFAIYIYDADHNIQVETWGMGGRDIRGNTCIKDAEGVYWMADRESGLMGDNFSSKAYHALPEGPYARSARKMDAYNFNIWVAGGGVNASFTSLWNGTGVYGLVDNEWTGQRNYENVVIPDFMDVAINPLDNSEIYAGSWHKGLVRIKDGLITNVFNETNSTLEITNFEAIDRIGVGAVNFDLNGNLWFSSHRQQEVLHVRLTNGDFVAYDLSPSLSEDDLITDILATQRGYIWVITKNNGLLVLDHNGTLSDQSDDSFKLLSTEEGDGALPSSEILSIEEDLDGEIWIGTNEGPAVFYSQEAIFDDENFDCQQIFITQDGNVQILLETEAISAIELDGGNRKWIGTLNSGVYLLSDEGTEVIYRFTTENSPLLSNTVNDIAINQEDGEVFFATSQGIIGFKNDASNFYENMEDLIKVYPNPVRPDYEGLISIDNLSRDVDVKIADISGNVIYQTAANGGRATWDGRKFDGEKVSTGVYLVFATSEDGSSTAVSKIAFIN